MSSSILNSEIREQPAIIRNLILEECKNAFRIAKDLQEKFGYVVIAARGTSDNAARYAQYLFGSYNQLQIALATPSLFTIYNKPPDLKHALVIGISQSGKSPDIVSVLAEGKRQGRPTIAITNSIHSPLASEADYVIPLNAGIERAVAATKTYTSSLAALALLSCAFTQNYIQLEQLRTIPAIMEKTINEVESSLCHVERYRYMEHCVVIGRGYNYSTAFEIALKVTELTGVVAEPYSSADFRHGPIATAHRGFPLMMVAPTGSVSPDLLDLINQLSTRGVEKMIISDDPSLLNEAQFKLPIPSGVPEWLTPLIAVLPGQMFGMQLAIERGLNPDTPEGLTKVTETF